MELPNSLPLSPCSQSFDVILSASRVTCHVLAAGHRQDYGLAAAITAGCTLFIVSGRVASKIAAQQKHNSLFGVVLMLTYLVFDGFTSTWQVRCATSVSGCWSASAIVQTAQGCTSSSSATSPAQVTGLQYVLRRDAPEVGLG